MSVQVFRREGAIPMVFVQTETREEYSSLWESLYPILGLDPEDSAREARFACSAWRGEVERYGQLESGGEVFRSAELTDDGYFELRGKDDAARSELLRLADILEATD